MADRIHTRFYKGYHEVKLPHKFKIAVGGCPNNCVKPDLNDFGIIGQSIPANDADNCKGCISCVVVDACPSARRPWRTARSAYLKRNVITADAVQANVHLTR